MWRRWNRRYFPVSGLDKGCMIEAGCWRRHEKFMKNSDRHEMSSARGTWQEIKLESLVGARSNLAIGQIKIVWCYPMWNRRWNGALLFILLTLREINENEGWIISRSTMYGWAGCVLHKPGGCHSHRSWYKWYSQSQAKHSGHPWHSMLHGSLVCFMWINVLSP